MILSLDVPFERSLFKVSMIFHGDLKSSTNWTNISTLSRLSSKIPFKKERQNPVNYGSPCTFSSTSPNARRTLSASFAF